MHTYSHAVFTWAVTRYAERKGSRAAAWGAAGSTVPDMPTLVKAGYLLWRHRDTMTKDEFYEALEYYEEPSGKLDLSVHSLVPVGSMLALYKLLGLERRDSHKSMLYFLLGWAGHNLLDLPTHSSDARPPFWPLLKWRWQSPISYWDRDCYALACTLVEHAAILALALAFLYETYREAL